MSDVGTSEHRDTNAAEAEVLKRERYELLQRGGDAGCASRGQHLSFPPQAAFLLSTQPDDAYSATEGRQSEHSR
jgi:hypothetical protein